MILRNSEHTNVLHIEPETFPLYHILLKYVLSQQL